MRDQPLAPGEFAQPPELAHEAAPRDAGSVPPPATPSVPVTARGARPGGGRARTWLVLAAALAVAGVLALALGKAAGGGTAALPGTGARTAPAVSASAGPPVSISPSAGRSARPSAASSMNMGVEVGQGTSGPATLAGVLQAADTSVEGRGLLPPGQCGDYRQNATGAVVCTAPVPGVAEVFYQNYSSLAALYSAYRAQVTQLDGGRFAQNTGTCGDGAVSYAEFGWNQEEGHPHGYTVAQMAAGKVPQIYAGGRMACFAVRTSRGVTQDIVWTIGNGPALGVAIGDGPPRAVYELWASLHHAVLFRDTEMCGTAERMNLADIPPGNLKVIPVCPSGVQAVPASPAR